MARRLRWRVQGEGSAEGFVDITVAEPVGDTPVRLTPPLRVPIAVREPELLGCRRDR